MTKLSKIHLLIAIVTFIFVTSLKGQVIQTKPEMIPYRLTPDLEMGCHFIIDIIEPLHFGRVPVVLEEETKEIIYERIVFEITNPYATSSIFEIDDKQYFLIRIPYTGADWDNGLRDWDF